MDFQNYSFTFSSRKVCPIISWTSMGNFLFSYKDIPKWWFWVVPKHIWTLKATIKIKLTVANFCCFPRISWCLETVKRFFMTLDTHTWDFKDRWWQHVAEKLPQIAYLKQDHWEWAVLQASEPFPPHLRKSAWAKMLFSFYVVLLKY